jgi:hypothetical protein
MPGAIIAQYNQRNFTTRFDVPYPVWTLQPPVTEGVCLPACCVRACANFTRRDGGRNVEWAANSSVRSDAAPYWLAIV